MSRRPTVSARTRRRVARVLQAALLVLLVYGVLTGQPKTITNAAFALAITALPAVLEHNFDIPLDPWLALWITTAVFLHTLGSSGLYTSVSWWDHLTHATSASLVAGVGYTVVRAIDLHSDAVHVPRRFAFAYILVVVLAFGVLWELFEFALDNVAAATGMTMPVAQEGLDDTVRDLLFNSVGALLVAAFGHAYLTGLADRIRQPLLARQ